MGLLTSEDGGTVLAVSSALGCFGGGLGPPTIDRHPQTPANRHALDSELRGRPASGPRAQSPPQCRPWSTVQTGRRPARPCRWRRPRSTRSPSCLAYALPRFNVSLAPGFMDSAVIEVVHHGSPSVRILLCRGGVLLRLATRAAQAALARWWSFLGGPSPPGADGHRDGSRTWWRLR